MFLLVAPLRRAADRFSFTVLVTLALAIMVVGKADPALVSQIRMRTADAAAPALGLLHQPVETVSDIVDAVHRATALYQENAALRADNSALMQWQSVSRRLAAENDALRQLLNYQPQHATWFVTARVIGTAGGAFSRNLLIDRGREDSIARGQAAITGTGLIGRIVEVGQRAARVLMVTDLNSRIPVVVGAARTRAILAGDNTDWPTLDYLSSHSAAQIGDLVVTSGDGGVLPPDLPVGVVASTDDGQIRVQPSTTPDRVDYLRIVDFGLSGVLPGELVPGPPVARRGPATHVALPAGSTRMPGTPASGAPAPRATASIAPTSPPVAR